MGLCPPLLKMLTGWLREMPGVGGRFESLWCQEPGAALPDWPSWECWVSAAAAAAALDCSLLAAAPGMLCWAPDPLSRCPLPLLLLLCAWVCWWPGCSTPLSTPADRSANLTWLASASARVKSTCVGGVLCCTSSAACVALLLVKMLTGCARLTPGVGGRFLSLLCQ